MLAMHALGLEFDSQEHTERTRHNVSCNPSTGEETEGYLGPL